jgi:hypothetical protein
MWSGSKQPLRVAAAGLALGLLLVSHANAGSIEFQLGRAFMTDDSWSPFDEQDLLQIEWSFANEERPFGWLVGAYGSRDEGSLIRPSGRRLEQRATQHGLYFGAVRRWRVDQRVQPFLQFGAGWGQGKINVVENADNNPTGAVPFAFVSGGVRFTVGDHLRLVAELRQRIAASDDAPRRGTNFSATELTVGIGVAW